MRVEQLEMTNFRGIRHLKLEFPTQSTLLVGINGVGKSAVLDALAAMLHRLVMRFPSMNDLRLELHGPRLGPSDVLNGAKALDLNIRISDNGREYSWILDDLSDHFMMLGAPPPLSEYIARLGQQLEEDTKASLPLVVQYSTNRGQWSTPIHEKNASTERHAAYKHAFPAATGSFDRFYAWFREREDLENEERARDNPQYRDQQLDSVRNAIETLLKGFSHLRIERREKRMTVRKNEDSLDVTQLSTGEKALLTLVGDLARRLVLANPGLENPRLGNGVVLIDEVDLHLHPRWQRTVISDLERTFPNCQFIVTTHSPQVLSEVQPEAIYLLERRNGETLANRPSSSFGLDSNRILEDLMGVDERPQRIKVRLRELFRLIDEGKLEEARTVRTQLEADIGPDEPNFAKADVLIRRKEMLPGAPHRPQR